MQELPHWSEPGGLVDGKSSTGQFVARGYYNPRTDIAIRILTHHDDEPIDIDFFRRRIRSAVELRQVFNPDRTNTYRLVNSEGDGLPGLILVRFAEVLVAQIHTCRIEPTR